jgi:hypothetical protein
MDGHVGHRLGSHARDPLATGNLRRVGRPRRELIDTTPLTAAYGSVGPREAWVLRTARNAHPDVGFHKGSTFQTLLALHGRSVSQASISRWESGEMQMPPWVAGLYERTLGHRMGTLQAPINGLRRSLTRTALRLQPLLETPRDSIGAEELVERLNHRIHDGHDWFLFAAFASRGVALEPEDGDWGRLVQRLLDEMCRSVGLAYTLRMEALAALATIDHALPHVVRAIGALVMDPSSQAVTDAISLLDYVPGDRGTNLTIKLMHHDRIEIRRSAAALAAVRLARGEVSRGEMPAMERAVAHVVTQTTQADPTLIDLVNRLPRRTPQVDALITNLRATQNVHQAQSTGELVRDDVAHLVTRRLAHETASDSSSNEPLSTMGLRLLREALFNSYLARRHQSALMLTAPDWRDALARAVVRALVDDHEPIVRGCLARLLTYIATPEVVADLAQAALDFVDVRGECVVAMAHGALELPADLPIESWLSSSADAAQRSQYMYAMGMTGHPGVERLAGDSASPMQGYARWWRARGPAVRDLPARVDAP